jgi:hypothetical protein
MKAGTAQKLVLNMLSTAIMVRLGRAFSHWMINVQSSNRKLRERGLRILSSATGASPTRAAQTLKAAGGNLPVALLMLHKGIKRDEALQLLTRGKDIAATLRASVGKHAIKITRADRDQWFEQATVAKGQTADSGSLAINRGSGGAAENGRIRLCSRFRW